MCSEAMSAQLTFFLLWKDWHFINNFVCLLLQIFFICILHRWELCVTKLHYAFIYTNNECQLLKHATVWKQLRKSRLLCTQERFLRVNRLLQNYSAVNTFFFWFTARMHLWCFRRLDMRAFCFFVFSFFFFWTKPL